MIPLGVMASGHVEAASGSPVSMWSEFDVYNDYPNAPTSGSWNVGTVIQFNVAGAVTALRYPEHSSSSSHVYLRLYEETGAPAVREVIYQSVSGRSGWVEMPITPYAVTAGQRLMPTFTNAPIDPYYAAWNFWTNAPFTSGVDSPDGSMTVPASVTFAGLTTYPGRYATTTDPWAKFPTATYQASNYWADVLFIPGGTP